MILAVLGLLTAVYLTAIHWSDEGVLCTPDGGCDTVRKSRYSEIGGIPVAILGAAGYVAILGLLLTEELEGPLSEVAPMLLFIFTLIGVLYSAYLTYLELFVILAICPYCVISAIIMTLLFIIALYRLLAIPGYEPEPHA